MTDSLSWMTIFKWENALARVIMGLPVPPPTSTITLPWGIEAQSKPERWVHYQLYKGVRQTLQETFRRIPFDCSPDAGIMASKFIFMRGIRHPGKEIVISVVGPLKRGARDSRWIGSTVVEVVNGCPPHVVGTDGSGESIRWEELETHKWPTYPEISHDEVYVVNFSSWLLYQWYGVPKKGSQWTHFSCIFRCGIPVSNKDDTLLFAKTFGRTSRKIWCVERVLKQRPDKKGEQMS